MVHLRGIFMRPNRPERSDPDDLRATELTSSYALDEKEKDSSSVEGHVSQLVSQRNEKVLSLNSGENTGTLSFEEDVAGGMGRHLGVFSCTMLIVGRMIGTAIFSTPSTILMSVHSFGASMMLWTLGFFFSICGLFIWMELGSMFPRSGGEKVYLEAVYKKPKGLTTVVFASNAILLGFTASGCVVFASNILVTAGVEATRWSERGIAIGVMIFVTLVHGLTPRMGIWMMNALSMFKIVILLFIIVTGWVVLSGHTRVTNPTANFHNAFAGSSRSSGDYATAMFKVLNAYGGWSNVNYVLNEVRDPVRTLKIAGPLGLGISTLLYMLANIAYFSAATVEEIENTGVTVASLFFGNVFGEKAQKALTGFVAVRYGSMTRECIRHIVFTVAFAQSRVNQELAKEGIPLPFGNKFWASNWPTGKSPLPGLVVHMIPSLIVIIAPPPAVVYPFILDVMGYPTQIINVFVICGLFWLRWKKPDVARPFKVWWPLAFFFLVAAVFLLVDPFIRPSNGVGDTPPLPYYLYCLVGIAVMFFGVFYWAMWRIILPKVFGYSLVPAQETLSDGTVVTVFRSGPMRKE